MSLCACHLYNHAISTEEAKGIQRSIINQFLPHAHLVSKSLIHDQFAPRALNAVRNSFTAVAASSKFSADIAHFACF
jgi:hypothetical protein